MTDWRVGEYRPTLDKTGNWVAQLPRLLKQWQSGDPVRHREAFRSLNLMATDADGWVRTAAMLRHQPHCFVEIEGGFNVDQLIDLVTGMELRDQDFVVALEAALAGLKRGSDVGG